MCTYTKPFSVLFCMNDYYEHIYADTGYDKELSKSTEETDLYMRIKFTYSVHYPHSSVHSA